MAWEGPHAFPKIHPTRLRIYHSTWENPRPDAEVVSFDFVSKMTTTAAPFLARGDGGVRLNSKVVSQEEAEEAESKAVATNHSRALSSQSVP